MKYTILRQKGRKGMVEAGIKDDSQVFNLPVGKSKYMVKRVHSGMKDDELGWYWLEGHKTGVCQCVV